MIRSRVIRTFISPTNNVQPHIDFTSKNMATILYLGKSDGDTILYNGGSGAEEDTRVSHKHNRLLIFDGTQLHAAVPPRTHSNRLIISNNFK